MQNNYSYQGSSWWHREQLTETRLALQEMIAAAATNQPGFGTTNRVMIARTLVARAVLNTVELAMEAAGGGAFYRSVALERLFRDAQGCRYHPLQTAHNALLRAGWRSVRTSTL